MGGTARSGNYLPEMSDCRIRQFARTVEREKCVKALKHAKNMFFDQKMHFFSSKSQNTQHVRTCIIRIWIQVVKDI